MKLVVRKKALADIDHIERWISQDNPAAAQNVADTLHEAIVRLSEFPYRGRKGRVPSTRELVFRGLPYVLTYRVNEERGEIVIVGITHGARLKRRPY